MTLRFTTSRVVGAAVALTVGAVSSAAAQSAAGASGSTPAGTTVQDSTRRASGATGRAGSARRVRGMSVRKDATTGTMGGSTTTDAAPAPAPEPAPAPAPVPEPVPAPAPLPEPVPAPAPAPEPVTTTTTVTETPDARFGNGFYVGLGAGANFPQNELNTVYDVGPSANLQLGYDPQTAPIGLRLNLGYNRLNGTTIASTPTTDLEVASSNLYSALLDAKLRLPFGRFGGATSGLYAVGGGGVVYFQDQQRYVGPPIGGNTAGTLRSEDATRFAANGGVGLDFGFGAASLFAEGRYVRVFTKGGNSNYIPVTLGLRFHTR